MELFMKKKALPPAAQDRLARRVEYVEDTLSSSSGWVDKDFDRVEDTTNEYVERLRNRGTF